MRVLVMKLKSGVSFVQFDRTWGGNVRFTDAPTPGAPGSSAKDTTATARPDLGGVLLQTTRINKFTGAAFNPFIVPFESIDGFEIDPESLKPPADDGRNVKEPAAAEEKKVEADEKPTEPEKRKPGRPPKAAALAAIVFALLAGPAAQAGDASSDARPPVSDVFKNIRCVDGPKDSCVTCANVKTGQFQVECGLPAAKTASGKK